MYTVLTSDLMVRFQHVEDVLSYIKSGKELQNKRITPIETCYHTMTIECSNCSLFA